MAEMVLGVIKVILTNIPENQRVTIFQGGFDGKLIGTYDNNEFRMLEQISNKFGLGGHLALTVVVEAIDNGAIYRYDNDDWFKVKDTKGWGK